MSWNVCPLLHLPSSWKDGGVLQRVPRRTIRSKSICTRLLWYVPYLGASYSSWRCKTFKLQNGTVFPSGLTALEPGWDPGGRGTRLPPFCCVLPTKPLRDECISVLTSPQSLWGLSAKGRLSLDCPLGAKYRCVLLPYLWLPFSSYSHAELQVPAAFCFFHQPESSMKTKLLSILYTCVLFPYHYTWHVIIVIMIAITIIIVVTVSTYIVLSLNQSALPTPVHAVLTATLWGRYHYHPHFI